MRQRFWQKVEVRGEDECWLWTASTDGRGYGRLSSHRGGSPMKAHRISYAIHHGDIPDGMGIMHSCDNPTCVNPNHLSLGDQAENMRGCSERGRLNPKSLRNLQPGAPGYHGAGPRRRGTWPAE